MVALAADNASVLSPDQEAYGKTYSEWAASWLQWVSSISADANPLNDSTGGFAGYGQSGPVWFLAGVTGNGGTVTRTAKIPAGKALFFPVVNYFWINLPELGDNPWSTTQETFVRGSIGGVMDTATGLSCQIDGHTVANLSSYRIRTGSQAFMVNLPFNDIWGWVASAGAHTGLKGPCLDDGFYLLVPPLSPGRHTIHFAGTVAATGFHLDVTYQLEVASPRHEAGENGTTGKDN